MEIRSIALAVGPLLIAGCSGGGSDPVTEVGKTVYTPAVQKIVLEDRGGGFQPLPPAGPCNPQVATYTLTIAGDRLAWATCDIVDTQPPTTAPRRGERALTTGEWDALQPKLAALVVDDSAQCGVDKPMLALIVATSEGTQEYGDGFYACEIHDRPLIESVALTAAEQAFRELAR